MIRVATLCTGSFEEQYKRCAVLKDLQNSHDWKEQFMACQRQLVRARRWMLGKARRAHAATSRASTPGGKAKAKAKSTASRAGATARASTPGAPSPAASTGATARRRQCRVPRLPMEMHGGWRCFVNLAGVAETITWSPKFHSSFAASSRSIVTTVLLIGARRSVPQHVLVHPISGA